MGISELYYIKNIKTPSALRRHLKSWTLQSITNWLNDQEAYQLRKPVHIPKSGLQPIGASTINELWQADLTFMTKKLARSSKNDNTYTLLTIIDVFSRKAYVIPLKSVPSSESLRGANSKTAVKVVQAFETVLKKVSPTILETDNGGEFKGEAFTKLVAKYHMAHIFAKPRDHLNQSIIESFNKTIKRMIANYLDENDTERWIDKLNTIVKTYNNNVHSTTKVAPNAVMHMDNRVTDAFRKKLKKVKRRKEYSVGDTVRHVIHGDIFDKNTLIKWTRELYKITKVYKFKKMRKVRKIKGGGDDDEQDEKKDIKEEDMKGDKSPRPYSYKIEPVNDGVKVPQGRWVWHELQKVDKVGTNPFEKKVTRKQAKVKRAEHKEATTTLLETRPKRKVKKRTVHNVSK